MYRRVPADLTETTSLGGLFSIVAGVFMAILCVVEIISFMSHTTETMVVLDQSHDQMIRINFNITMLDLPCRFAVVDVLDVLGTNRMNITKNIEKWNLDEEGRRRFFQGRNREEREILHDDHHAELEVLLQNGEHAIPLTADSFDEYMQANEFTFVSFYAPWCVWCQRLAPTWEAFAEHVEAESIPIKVAKVDCVTHTQLCKDQKVHAFPTLRLFNRASPLPPDYNTDRTVAALASYVTRRLNVEEKRKNWPERDREYVEHPGCMLSGHLLVNRVPGNFHIEARSKAHNLNAVSTNLSHVVNHLSFGPLYQDEVLTRLEKFSSEFYVSNSLDGRMFVLDEYHKAHHHYVKVVGTLYEVPQRWGKEDMFTYQMLPETSVMSYAVDDVPEAKFSYEISPMAVIVKRTGRRWYEFGTSLFGILGGTFTVVGLLDSTLHRLLRPSTKLRS